MNRIENLFTTLGGVAPVARALGITTSHACQMIRRRSIPIGYWPDLIAIAKSRSARLDERDLVQIHIAERPAWQRRGSRALPRSSAA